jgi:hypothetical protein
MAMADHGEAIFRRDVCAYCGDTVEISSWHPVAARCESDGGTWLAAFCDRTCRTAWERDRIEE